MCISLIYPVCLFEGMEDGWFGANRFPVMVVPVSMGCQDWVGFARLPELVRGLCRVTYRAGITESPVSVVSSDKTVNGPQQPLRQVRIPVAPGVAGMG